MTSTPQQNVPFGCARAQWTRVENRLELAAAGLEGDTPLMFHPQYAGPNTSMVPGAGAANPNTASCAQQPNRLAKGWRQLHAKIHNCLPSPDVAGSSCTDAPPPRKVLRAYQPGNCVFVLKYAVSPINETVQADTVCVMGIPIGIVFFSENAEPAPVLSQAGCLPHELWPDSDGIHSRVRAESAWLVFWP